MAKNENNNAPTGSPTDEVIRLYKEALAEKVESCESQKEAKRQARRTQDKVEGYRICMYVKAKETHEQYTNLKFCLTEGANKEASLLKNVVSSLKTKNSELATMIKGVSDMLKAAKTNMEAASDIACRLERSIEEEKRCKPDIYNALKDGVPNIWDRIQSIREHTNDKCFDKVTKAFDGAVDVAGIQTFANIASLDAFCGKVQTKATELKQNVDGNITSSTTKMQTASTNLIATQSEITKIKFEKSRIVSELEAKNELQEYVGKEKSERCPADPLSNIREACKKIEYDENAADTSESSSSSSSGTSTEPAV